MVGLKLSPVDMVRDVGNKWLVIFWERDSVMGWMVCGVQSVEKAVEFSLAYVTDVTEIHEVWLPQSVPK